MTKIQFIFFKFYYSVTMSGCSEVVLLVVWFYLLFLIESKKKKPFYMYIYSTMKRLSYE